MATDSPHKPNDSLALRARWVFPVDQPPIEGGVVTIAGGRIVAVGENSSGQPPRDLGDVALIPGLVNAHTHLEFSTLERPLGQPNIAFPEWIRAVVEHRREQGKKLVVETDGFQRFRRRAAQAGLKELQAGGTVAVGEIATPGWPRECFPAAGLTVTIFLELLGLEKKQQPSLLAMAKSFVGDILDAAAALRPGLSPHAPYTAGSELVEEACKLSAAERVPVAMHLAESREELQLLGEHAGPLVEVLQSLGAWHPDAVPRGSRPIDYLEMLATAHRALVIHGNYLAAEEIEFLGSHRERMSAVYCPRTHAYFGHEPYPLAAMLAARVRVAVGTDSLATNPDLSLFRELRQISRTHRDVPPEAILRMGTLAGAEALGIQRELGSITTGKVARLAIVQLTATTGEPYELLFAAGKAAQPLAV
jgi:cytosine/adenosine deaminase-related metal-dependent hydrolase